MCIGTIFYIIIVGRLPITLVAKLEFSRSDTSSLTTEDVRTDVGQTASLVSQLVVTPHKMLAQCKVGESHRPCSAQRETKNKT